MKTPEPASQLLNEIFRHVAKTVNSNYEHAPYIPGDKNLSGKYALQSVTIAPNEQDGRYLPIRTHDNVAFGLQVKNPSLLRRMFGIKADIVVLGDSVNILSMGTDFSNTKRYGMTSRDDSALEALGAKIAKGLETQYRIRKFLGI